MNNNDKLLSLYREYETILRDRSTDSKEYEEKMDEKTGARLRMCRLFRNYLSHQDDVAFLSASDAQIKFLESKIKELKVADDTVKKHMKTVAAAMCTDTDRCTDVTKKMSKLKVTEIIVVRKSGACELCSIFDIANSALETKTSRMTTVKGKKPKQYVSPVQKFNTVTGDSVFIVPDNGREDGKLLGVLYS